MSNINEQVQKQVEQDRRNGKTGFDRDAYNKGSSQYREAVDAATTKK